MINFIRMLALFSPLLLLSPQTAENYKSDGSAKKRIVLLGASIGRNWNISYLPERIGNHDYIFEYVDGGAFDKSVKLMEILARRENKPDAIFLKECAAYFPGDFKHYQSLVKQWIEACHKANVIPIPTTVVPVTRLHSLKKFAIDIVKLRNPFKMGSPLKANRQRAILAFNEWIRTFCAQNDLVLLDLEKAVRKSEKNRFLRSALAKVDGLHLNQKGYKLLDQIVIPTIEKVSWK